MKRASVSVLFLTAVAKCSTRNSLKKEGFVLASSLKRSSCHSQGRQQGWKSHTVAVARGCQVTLCYSVTVQKQSKKEVGPCLAVKPQDSQRRLYLLKVPQLSKTTPHSTFKPQQLGKPEPPHFPIREISVLISQNFSGRAKEGKGPELVGSRGVWWVYTKTKPEALQERAKGAWGQS